jgi:predicted transposase YdaD
VRERALRDEVSLLNEAKREGRAEGREEGRAEGREERREEVARNLIAMNLLTDEQIAAASGLKEVEVKSLRDR